MKTIEVNDVCAVEHVSIPIPEEGGVVILRGTNGCGKSTTLLAVDRLATGREHNLTPRDGAVRGEVSGGGVTLRIGKKITRTGELEFESLESRLSVAEVVDPGLKGPEENDARRIRALVQLAGVKPDVKLFYPLFDDVKTFDEVTKGKSLDTDDILVMADRIKRAIDEAARSAEGQANVEKAKAAACKESASGISLNVEVDDAKLQTLLEDAIRHDQMLQSQASSARERNAEITAARDKIAETTGHGESLESLRDRESGAKACMLSAQEMVDQKKVDIAKLQAELKELEAASDLADEKWSSLSQQVGQAELFEETIQGLKDTVALGELALPTDRQLSDAFDSVANCRASIESGVLARRANEQISKGKIHAAKELDGLKKAESLRESAKRIDEVLSDQISKLGVALTVKAGRLVTKTGRGTTLYADLSEGERWKMALDIAIEVVGTGGILAIPQEAFESLAPSNRELIKEHVHGKGVVFITALVTDGPISAAIESKEYVPQDPRLDKASLPLWPDDDTPSDRPGTDGFER